MNLFNLKKEIEEKSIALDELIKECEKEQKKIFLFKSEKKINELQKKISDLDEEIAELEKTYNNQLELKKAAGNAAGGVASFTKKHGLKTAIGCAVAGLAYLGYLSNKPLTYDGEQTTYRAMVDSFESTEISSDEYTPETYERYMQSLEEAEAQKGDIFMSDEQKLAFLEAVSSSYDDLEPMPDKTALRSALSKANTYDVSAYTPFSVGAFKNEIAKSQAVFDDANATGKEVAAAEKEVADAYDVLTLKADKTALSELLEQYSDYAFDEYTPSSVKRFNKEIQDAETVIADDNALQDTVDKRVKAMETIETLLVKRADKSSLQKLIDECNKLDGDDYKTGYDELMSEVDSSTSILDNADISQEEVDSAVSRIKTARSDLVEYTTYVYRVNMNAYMETNNSVGNDWSYDRYFNGKYTHDGFEVSGNPGTTGLVAMQITENDSYPDVGYGNASITLKDGYQTSFSITVVENRGRYYGHTATFTVDVYVSFLRRE